MKNVMISDTLAYYPIYTTVKALNVWSDEEPS